MSEVAREAMARQLAQLLAGSDLDELGEVIARWKASATSERERQRYDELGSRLLELKAELSRAPVPPTLEELEAALTMMLRLATTAGAEQTKLGGRETKRGP
jgi:hypothetical protein